jgi:hypothetical protein
MRNPTNRDIWILFGAAIVLGVATLAYREQLRLDAHWITKTLCDDMPVFTGQYKRCIDHYAPAGADRYSGVVDPS